jgi:hypothetical protein
MCFIPFTNIRRTMPLSYTLHQPSALYPMTTPFPPSCDKQHTKEEATPPHPSEPPQHHVYAHCICLSYAHLFTGLLVANLALSLCEVGMLSLFTVGAVREIYHGGDRYTVKVNFRIYFLLAH